MIRTAFIFLMLVAPIGAGAEVKLECRHVTKSTLKQTSLARPLFAPGDVAQVELRGDATGTIRVDGSEWRAALRICPKGGTWSADCPQARALNGDVISVYATLDMLEAPATLIWGRKAADGHELVENVVLRCCSAQTSC